MAFEAPLYYLGLITAGYLTLIVGSFLHHYLRPSSLMQYKHGAESWALITAASDGIGLGFAKELCRKGFNVTANY
jgi:17beta-estradiol 17-dehydrogenase / very-long-chain 3-oxoacyl-CoA reductase